MQIRVMNHINTPIKRIGFIALIIGVLFLAVGIILMFSDVQYYRYQYGYNQNSMLLRYLDGLTNQIIKSLSFNTESSSFNFFLGAGFYLTIMGFLFSFAYEKGLGRIINWVKKG